MKPNDPTHRRRAVVLIAAIAMGSTLAAAASGQPPVIEPPPPAESKSVLVPEGEPAFDLAQAEGWRDEMLPIVERVTGRRFAGVPGIRLVNRETLLRSLVADGILQARALEPSLDTGRAELELTLDMLLIAPAMLGRYSLADRVIELPAGNVAPLMATAGLDDDQLGTVMRLTVAHELAHALHVQEIDLLGQLEQTATADGVKAWNATLEGFGMLVQQRVAESQGLEEANGRVVRLMGLSGSDRPEAAAMHRRFAELYRAGWDFLQAIASERGMDGVWAVLADPPPVYVQVREPRRYGEAVATEMDADRLYRGFRRMLNAEGFDHVVTQTDPEAVGRTYRALGDDVAAGVRASVRQAYTLLLSDRSRGIPRIRSLTLFELTSAEAGATLMDQLGAMRDAQFGRLRALGDSSGLEVREDEPHAIAGVEAQRSRLYRIAVRSPEAPEEAPSVVEMTLAAAWRGDDVVQLVATGGSLPDAAVAGAIDELLDRSASGAGMVPIVEPDAGHPIVAAISRIEPLLPGEGWSLDLREVGRSAAALVVGEDVRARMAVEMTYVNGFAANVDQAPGDGSSPAVFVTVFQLASDASAGALVGPLLDGADSRLEQLSTMMGADLERRDMPELDLGDGRRSPGRTVAVRQGGATAAKMTVRTTHLGPYAIQVAVFNGALDEGALRDYLDAMVATLAEPPPTPNPRSP